ncbi:hypothetical protein JOD29_000747 [Lysinibacillus composti]|uniref:Uncharacterized protein n=1 Tax=Lysinibacillus composti TaxID=720633 RepID=A0A3N9U9W3_9BACI|nr:hypothetical protein [Lysinibacillus composti]MBM7607510.1 hypothetical protein [Lysinibacillus composti]RQW73344.1 hypothetical protein EBB45_16970 [Lysinibacillus composti]
MRISKARYIVQDDIEIVTLKQITKKKYEAIYKGKLFCPTENCPAKVSFCSGRKKYYKTWRFSNHSPDCIYHLDRSGRRSVKGLNEYMTMNMGSKRKQNALMRAYKSMVDPDSIEISVPTSVQKPKHNKSPQKDGEVKERSVQMKLFGGEMDEDGSVVKGKKLLSRFVNEIGPSDMGQHRVIKGVVKKIDVIDTVAEILVGYHEKEIKVIFEESFKKDPFNKSYLNKFWAVKKLLKNDKIVFSGVGKVRQGQENEYELSISLGSDFKLNGEDLYNIAKRLNAKVFI